MNSHHRLVPTFDTLSIDIYSWVWAAVSVTLIAACLVVLGTLMQKAPVLVVSESGGSMANDYVELRHRVEGTLPAVRVTSDPAEILGRGVAIGIAVRAARHAEQGEVFTPVAAEHARALIAADMTRRSVSDRATLMNDVPTTAARVNEPYPLGEALATFPSLLLQVLPRLPDDLEYRFMGRDLIIWDARTNLIVDVLPDVMNAAEVTP